MAVERDGIVSFQPKENRTSQRLSDHELDELVEAVANQSTRNAAGAILAENEHRTEILTELFDVQQELWQPLVANHIGGRCLDLHTGYGRRSVVLSELADSIFAVDPSLAKLRVAAKRDDYASSDRIVPIHTTDERLPFRNDWFDTIVADLTGNTAIEPTLDRLKRYLTDDGSLIFMADGWPRSAGLTSLFGLDGSDSTETADLLPGTAAGYRSIAQTAGFDDVSVYALFPTASRPLYAFDVECEQAIPKIFESYANENGFVGDCIKEAMNVLNSSGILKRCYPSLLVVCSNESDEPSFQFTNPLVISGRTRSVVLELDSSGVNEIYKIPNSSVHEPFTARENHITSSLCETDEEIVATIPGGEAIDSRLGQARKVTPATGQPLDEEIGRDPESFERVLEIGFDWLIDFQRTFGSEPTIKTPAEVRNSLQFQPLNVDPPAVDSPVKTFTTPVHGDFMSSNIYYEDGTITAVIDWEYGAFGESPVVDAGHLLFNTAAWIDGDFAENVRTVLCGRNEYAERARACVRSYCEAVGLPYRTFELYLPSAYLHQLTVDWQYNSVSTCTTRTEAHARRIQTIVETIDDMKISK
ncbi:phosphotransferase [Halosolutus amylolyticus]|uniref:Phosphotransferase n=1 Tax=Halosolutus amylolyticus TaxID=2932267 RepID=A0ABD5PN28_9EURY|nr:class I SAM-dependent methyltransferase [Halosolutus amylolyticus]